MEQAVLPMAKKYRRNADFFHFSAFHKAYTLILFSSIFSCFRYGVKTIFLATDDASLFTAADGICAWPQFKWLYLPPPDAAIHGGYSDAKLKSGEIDGCVN